MILTGGSKTTRYGVDFSRNITTNFEIHGEFAFINDFKKRFIDSNGNAFEEEYDAKSYLIGIRYLTEKDTTYILEYYRNGPALPQVRWKIISHLSIEVMIRIFPQAAMRPQKEAVTEGIAGRPNPRDYLICASPKGAVRCPSFYPVRYHDSEYDRQSFPSPELLYTGITNLNSLRPPHRETVERIR
jgi:hypothetical protein